MTRFGCRWPSFGGFSLAGKGMDRSGQEFVERRLPVSAGLSHRHVGGRQKAAKGDCYSMEILLCVRDGEAGCREPDGRVRSRGGV